MTPFIDEFTSARKGFLVEAIDNVLIIRFNRPEIRNPLSCDVIDELSKFIDEVTTSAASRIVFTGSGTAFASGADLREIGSLTPFNVGEFAERGQSLMKRIEDLPITTVAAINGYCFGGGLDLALACKKRVASHESLFCHPGVGLGIITGWGGTQRLPRLVGEGLAMEMLLTASRLSAKEALRIGLVDTITEDVVMEALD
jgi:enoyl-CoA hydratase